MPKYLVTISPSGNAEFLIDAMDEDDAVCQAFGEYHDNIAELLELRADSVTEVDNEGNEI